MAKAKLAKQIFIETSNQVGQLAEVSSSLSEANVNIMGICAWGMENKACFALLVDKIPQALQALKTKGLQPIEQEIVTVMLEDKIGAAAEVAQKIKEAGINLDYVYGTTCGCKGSSQLVIISKENAKIVSCLQT